MSAWLKKIESLLPDGQPSELVWEEILREMLRHFSSETGTIHRLDPPTQLLQLVAQVGLPAQMVEIVKTIPVGKGIAGQVVAQNRPVTICNLQTDTSGIARPGARETGVGGALCVPVRLGEKIVGTLGIGTLRKHEYTGDETAELEAISHLIGLRLA